MKLSKPLSAVILSVSMLFSVNALRAEGTDALNSNQQAMQQKITALLTITADQIGENRSFLEDLKKQQDIISGADPQVAELIQKFTEMTDLLEDGGEVDVEMKKFMDEAIDTLAEVQASTNETLKAALLPVAEASVARLKKGDERRAELVIEARNLIKSLEQSRKDIVLAIKVDAIDIAAKLMEENLNQVQELLDKGKALANDVGGVANP